MTVVAGHRAYEGRRLAPWFRRTGDAFQQRPDDAVVHHREAGIVGDEDLAGRCTEHRGEQGAGFGQALQHAVVPGVIAGLADVVAVARQGQQAVRQIQLLGRRLAARHVELEAPRAEGVIFAAHVVAQRLEIGIRQIGDTVHGALGIKAHALSRIGADGNLFCTRCHHA